MVFLRKRPGCLEKNQEGVSPRLLLEKPALQSASFHPFFLGKPCCKPYVSTFAGRRGRPVLELHGCHHDPSPKAEEEGASRAAVNTRVCRPKKPANSWGRVGTAVSCTGAIWACIGSCVCAPASCQSHPGHRPARPSPCGPAPGLPVGGSFPRRPCTPRPGIRCRRAAPVADPPRARTAPWSRPPVGSTGMVGGTAGRRAVVSGCRGAGASCRPRGPGARRRNVHIGGCNVPRPAAFGQGRKESGAALGLASGSFLCCSLTGSALLVGVVDSSASGSWPTGPARLRQDPQSIDALLVSTCLTPSTLTYTQRHQSVPADVPFLENRTAFCSLDEQGEALPLLPPMASRQKVSLIESGLNLSPTVVL